ncbi:hypothetical protein DKZ23_03480 [Limosilactobacillus reuteri]|uniref:Uncharacterized protein n=2 Tax=Limosilactobacillus reuteri TaxID=1598 RepID=A0A317GH69_LIMRT|nr:hypothetical protein DKZ23_03480 [Limosilactobacillus reuteri]PWT52488.1 hypothetical protein DKZ33_03395 [Limosilactobacillus reuteri]PWT63192.1 hypothetical protein DKZ32_03380 [Limosilactobacillus reuteri]
MIILNSMSPTAYSGLVAALISGCVSLIGYIATTIVQKNTADKTVKTQKEIAQMQKDEKLFYESQLEWANETRKLIAKFISDSFRFNIVVENMESIRNDVSKSKFNQIDAADITKKLSDNLHRSGELLSLLNEEATMIRLYLFHKDDDHEKEVLNILDKLENDMNGQLGIDKKLLNEFVDVARDYFNYQMKDLKTKSA